MSTYAASSDDATVEELSELAGVMRDGLGAAIKDRTHRLRTYKRCFAGSAGVRWLVACGHAADEAGAVALGNAMLRAGLLHHVAYEQTFKDSDLLYKFSVDDETGHHRELSRGGAGGNGSASGTPRGAGPPVPLLQSMASEPIRGSLLTRRARLGSSNSGSAGGAAPGAGGAPGAPSSHPHAHRALVHAQVHSLNQKLERLASQHAALVVAHAQQQETWDAQASSDLRDLKEAINNLGSALAPTQRDVLAIAASVASLRAQASSQRALVAAQQAVMALALLAVGAGWPAPALWALAAAAAAGLLAVLLGWGDGGAEEAERAAAAREALDAQARVARAMAERAQGAGGAAAANAGARGAGGLAPVATKGAGARGGALRVLATTSQGSAGSSAPPPMSAAVAELQAGRAIAGKTVDELAPPLAAFESWPDGPLMLRPSPRAPDVAVTRVERYAAPGQSAAPTAAHRVWEAAQKRWAAVAAEADADDASAAASGAANSSSWVPAVGAGVPINQYCVHFESDLFVGKMLLYVRGLPSSYEPYFAGKKRRSVLMFQGRFKRPVGVNDLVTGMEYARPYKNLRGCWLMEKVVLAFAKRVVSAMETGDMASEPFITFHLLPLAHVVNVSLPGQEPPIESAPEDLRLWDPTLSTRSGEPMAADARRRHFMMERHRKGRTYSTEHVWTFCIWQQVIDYAGYYLDLLVQQYDVIQHLDGQPLQAMMKDKASKQYLFNFLYWNRKQLEDTHRARAEAAAANKI